MKKFTICCMLIMFFASSSILQAAQPGDHIPSPLIDTDIQTNTDGKDVIFSPNIIYLCGHQIKVNNREPKDVLEDIAEAENWGYTAGRSYQENFIVDKAKAISFESDLTPVEIVKSINDLISLSNTTAWSPTNFAGKTAHEIVTMNNYDQFIQFIQPEYIKNEVIELQKQIQSQGKISKSPSENAHEWLFIFKKQYDDFTTAQTNGSFDQSSLDSVLSTSNKTLGAQCKNILLHAIQANKNYIEYLTILLATISPAAIDYDQQSITAPEFITVDKERITCPGKKIQTLYTSINNLPVDQNLLIGAINPLKTKLMPKTVRDNFQILWAEKEYCDNQKQEIQKTISLFSVPAATQLQKQPESFGIAWLKDPKLFIGNTQTIVISQTENADAWNKNIAKLKSALTPKATLIGNQYKIASTAPVYTATDPSLYAQELQLSTTIAIQQQAQTMLKALKSEKLYPAPLDVFQQVWQSLYVKNTAGIYQIIIKKTPTNLVDPENVDALYQALLSLWIAIDYGTISKAPVKAELQAEGFPDDLMVDLLQAAQEKSIAVTSPTKLRGLIAKCDKTTKLPDGWKIEKVGMSNGLKNPSNQVTNLDELFTAIQAYQKAHPQDSTSSTTAGGGSVDRITYESLVEHLQGKPIADKDRTLIIAAKSGYTYEQYIIYATTGKKPSSELISDTDYAALLKIVQDAKSQPGKKGLKKMSAKTFISQNDTYKGASFTKDSDFLDILFPALFDNTAYEQFIASEPYQTYKKENPLTASSTAVSTEPAGQDESHRYYVDSKTYGHLKDQVGIPKDIVSTYLQEKHILMLPHYQEILIHALKEKAKYEDYVDKAKAAINSGNGFASTAKVDPVLSDLIQAYQIADQFVKVVQKK